VFSLTCAITKKDLRYEAGHDDRGLDISKFTYGVCTSHVCATQYTKVDLASLTCVDMASEHGDRKVKHGSQGCAIDIVLSTFDDIALSAVMIRGGVVEKDRVISRTVLGMLF
jgi:hypothetical protein